MVFKLILICLITLNPRRLKVEQKYVPGGSVFIIIMPHKSEDYKISTPKYYFNRRLLFYMVFIKLKSVDKYIMKQP